MLTGAELRIQSTGRDLEDPLDRREGFGRAEHLRAEAAQGAAQTGSPVGSGPAAPGRVRAALHNVTEFVGQHLITGRVARFVRTSPEEDVRAGGEGAGRHRTVQFGGPSAG